MARTLRDTPPSSSIARLLDTGAAARATAPRDAAPAAMTGGAVSETGWSDRPDAVRPSRIKREVLLCPETDEVLDELVRILRRSTRARVTTSHVVRALLLATSKRLEIIRRQATHLGPRRLPSNAQGNDQARRDFEETLAALFFSEPPAV